MHEDETKGIDGLSEQISGAEERRELERAWERLGEAADEPVPAGMASRFRSRLARENSGRRHASRRRAPWVAAAFAAGLAVGLLLGPSVRERSVNPAVSPPFPVEVAAALRDVARGTAPRRLAALEVLESRLPACEAGTRLLLDIALEDPHPGVRLVAVDALLLRLEGLEDAPLDALHWRRVESPLEQLAWIEVVAASGSHRAATGLGAWLSAASGATVDELVGERAREVLNRIDERRDL